MPRGRPATWTIEEDIKIITRRADGMLPAAIADKLARTEVAVIARLEYHRANRIEEAKRVVEEGSYGLRWRSAAHRAFLEANVSSPPIVSEIPALSDVIELVRDQLYASMADRDLTATLCGDPTPNRTALLAAIEAGQTGDQR